MNRFNLKEDVILLTNYRIAYLSWKAMRRNL